MPLTMAVAKALGEVALVVGAVFPLVLAIPVGLSVLVVAFEHIAVGEGLLAITLLMEVNKLSLVGACEMDELALSVLHA